MEEKLITKLQNWIKERKDLSNIDLMKPKYKYFNDFANGYIYEVGNDQYKIINVGKDEKDRVLEYKFLLTAKELFKIKANTYILN